MHHPSVHGFVIGMSRNSTLVERQQLLKEKTKHHKGRMANCAEISDEIWGVHIRKQDVQKSVPKKVAKDDATYLGLRGHSKPCYKKI